MGLQHKTSASFPWLFLAVDLSCGHVRKWALEVGWRP